MPANDIVIEGWFVKNNYTVIYAVNGEVYAKESVAYGDKIIVRDNPVKEGYTFNGWSDAPETMPAYDVVITGTFTANIYTVTYMIDGEVFATNNIPCGTAIPLIDVPRADRGYTFDGWGDVPEVMPARDIVIMGAYVPEVYTVTYMIDDDIFAIDSVSYGDEIILIDAPVKEGYIFGGWGDVPEVMPARDVVVTGIYIVNVYTITYMLDGEVYATDSVSYGDEIVLIDAPVKEGYVFSGWSEAPETMPANDVVIEGSFTSTGIDGVDAEEQESVIYNMNGTRVTSDVHNLDKGVYIVNGKKVFVK